MNQLCLQGGAASDAASIHWDLQCSEIVPKSLGYIGLVAEASDPSKNIALALKKPSVIGITQASRGFNKRIENSL